MQETELGGFRASPAQLGAWYAQPLDPAVPIDVARYMDVHRELDATLLREAAREYESVRIGAAGGVSYQGRPDGHRDPAYSYRVIDECLVIAVHFAFSMREAFLPGREVAYRKTLRTVFASGAALPAALARRLRMSTCARPRTLYGPTEAAGDVTFHEVAGTDTLSMPIGAPVFDTRLYVLDARLRPVPVGAPGELYLSGVQLARGYVARLVAYVLAAEPGGVRPDRLRTASAEALPGYPVTAACVVLDTFPVDASGRLDRREAPSSTSAGYATAVARVFAEVVGNKPVGRNDDYFTLGGNSPVATQVAAPLPAELNCPLGVRHGFAACTVAELAGLAERAGGSSGASLVAQLRARPRPPLVPLSPAGLRIRFEQVVAALDPPRARTRHLLFPALLAFDNAEAIGYELPELSVATSTLDTGVTELDPQLTVTENSAGAGLGEGSASAGVLAEFTYATDLFDSATVARCARGLGFLRAAIADPVLESPFLDRVEQARVIAAGRAPIVAHDSARTLPTACVAQVRRTPGTVAVFDGEQRLTCAAFAGAVDRPARRLVGSSVGTQRLGMRRSADLVVAAHAVLTAGGAHLPVDSAVPGPTPIGRGRADLSAERFVVDLYGPAGSAVDSEGNR
ncbi:AMP-binding protein [Nocardia barduliensis]|uniref:AMP-binding protein n=1 Tax=Nocardia barduliensis TaxID=2736643 RepID=UPI0028AC3CF3|nr:AMP-binding protein [Nocardia barduliensis]